MFQGSFKSVSRKFQGCFKKVSRVFQGNFKDVSGYFKKVSWMFQECFNKALFCNFVVACKTSQLPEQKKGLLHFLHCTNTCFAKLSSRNSNLKLSGVQSDLTKTSWLLKTFVKSFSSLWSLQMYIFSV